MSVLAAPNVIACSWRPVIRSTPSMSTRRARSAAEQQSTSATMHRRTLLKTGTAGLLAARWAKGESAMAEPLHFPPGFVWGVSTSSCQIEGRGDRKADSIWDTFARIDGTIGDRN